MSSLSHPINLNDSVRVVLTDKGLALLNAHYKKYEYSEETQKTEKDRKFQLWELMHIFGPNCFIGSPPFFEKHLIYVCVPGTLP